MAGTSRRCSVILSTAPSSPLLLAHPSTTSASRPSRGSLQAAATLSTSSSLHVYAPRSRRFDKRPELSPRIQQELAVFEERCLSDPFHLIMASPMRRCIVTKQIMPRDLLIALKPVFLPPVPPSSEVQPKGDVEERVQLTDQVLEQAFVPDQILHQHYTPLKPGPSAYFCASKRFLVQLAQSTKSRSTGGDDSSSRAAPTKRAGSSPLRLLSHTAFLPDRIEAMITHQLQTRVIQEAQLLSHAYQSKGEDGSDNHIVLDSDLTTSIFNFADTPSEEALEGIQGSPLPIKYNIPKLFPSPDQFSKAETLLKSLSIQRRDVYQLPMKAESGPLAVALWRLRNWVQS